MKRLTPLFIITAVVATLALTLRADAPQKLPFPILQDGINPPYTASGYMGDTPNLVVDEKCPTKPRSGATCLKITYKDPAKWVSVAWQNPTNDWGDKPGGYNLTGAKKLTVWARGEKGGEKIKVGFGGIGKEKKFPDSAKGELDLTLTTDWKQYVVDATDMDLTHIKTGFFWLITGQGAPITVYLDDIRWE